VTADNVADVFYMLPKDRKNSQKHEIL